MAMRGSVLCVGASTLKDTSWQCAMHPRVECALSCIPLLEVLVRCGKKDEAIRRARSSPLRVP